MNPKQEILQVLFDACVFTGNFSELGRRLGYINNGRSTIGRVRSGHRNLKEKTLDELFEKLHEEYLISPDDMATLADSIAYGKDLFRQLREAYGTGSDWHDMAFSAIVTENYNRAVTILTENKERLKLIADKLMEFETLSGKQVAELLETGEMTDPPVRQLPPPIPVDEDAPTDLETPDDEPPAPAEESPEEAESPEEEKKDNI